MVDLTQHSELVVRQVVEHLEVFTGLETQNRYRVSTPEGEELLYMYEQSGFLGRQFLKTHRPLELRIVDNQGQLVLQASRRFFWFFSHLHVRDAAGQPLGSLQRQFALVRRLFTLQDDTGQTTGLVRGSLFRPNTFFIERDGVEAARVTKRWSGVLKEAFSRADTFRVEFGGPVGDQRFALLVLAVAFAIDLDFFESGGRR